MKKNLLFPVFVATIFLISCTNDSTSDLLEDIEITNVTYTTNIKSIIDNNCISCHATVPINYAPMSLTTYENVKEAMLNRGLIDRISKDQGDSDLMPYGGARLPQQLIDIVIEWQNQGLLE